MPRLRFFSVALIVWMVCSPMYAVAAEYSLSPLIIDLELEKRDIVYRDITITNQSNKQVRIFPSVNEVNLDEDGSIESFVEPSMVDDRTSAVTSWIQVPRKRIEIAPGESATVPVTFKVHPEVQAGEYHAIIGFGTGSNQPQAHAQVMAGIAPVVAVRVGVEKVQNEFLRLERFLIERFVTDGSEGSIQYNLHNPGEDPVTPGGEIILYDNRGNEVGSVPVNPEGLTVSAGETVTVTSDVPDDLSIGKYKAFLSVEFGKNLTASVHDTTFFYVVPLRQLLMIFVAVLVVAIIIGLLVHWRYRVDEEEEYEAAITDIPLYLRTERSAAKDHDLDLSQKK